MSEDTQSSKSEAEQFAMNVYTAAHRGAVYGAFQGALAGFIVVFTVEAVALALRLIIERRKKGQTP